MGGGTQLRPWQQDARRRADAGRAGRDAQAAERMRRGGVRVHAPVAEGKCVACHNGHASENSALLKKPVSQLCAECHKTDTEKMQKAHSNYSLAKADCTTCHDPHLSQKKGTGSDSSMSRRIWGQEGMSSSEPVTVLEETTRRRRFLGAGRTMEDSLLSFSGGLVAS